MPALVVKSVLTLVLWVKQDHMFVTVWPRIQGKQFFNLCNCQSLANITAKSLLKMSVAVVKDGLTLVPWVKQDHMFVAVLAKEPR